jgi:hypothetical protein
VRQEPLSLPTPGNHQQPGENLPSSPRVINLPEKPSPANRGCSCSMPQAQWLTIVTRHGEHTNRPPTAQRPGWAARNPDGSCVTVSPRARCKGWSAGTANGSVHLWTSMNYWQSSAQGPPNSYRFKNYFLMGSGGSACKPSYSGGRNEEVPSQPRQIVRNSISKKDSSLWALSGSSQGVGPEFKPLYQKNKKISPPRFPPKVRKSHKLNYAQEWWYHIELLEQNGCTQVTRTAFSPSTVCKCWPQTCVTKRPLWAVFLKQRDCLI